MKKVISLLLALIMAFSAFAAVPFVTHAEEYNGWVYNVNTFGDRCIIEDYTAKTNKKGVATFKLILNKNGKFTSTVTFKGDDYYKAKSQKAKITVKGN